MKVRMLAWKHHFKVCVKRAETLNKTAAEGVEITGWILEEHSTQDCWAITAWKKGGVEDDSKVSKVMDNWVGGTIHLENTAEEGLCKIILSSVWGLTEDSVIVRLPKGDPGRQFNV